MDGQKIKDSIGVKGQNKKANYLLPDNWLHLRARSGTRTRTAGWPQDFLTNYDFRRYLHIAGVCGLDYPFAMDQSL